MGDEHPNDSYEDPGASGPPPIPDAGVGNAAGGTIVGAQNDRPENAEDNADGDPLTDEPAPEPDEEPAEPEPEGEPAPEGDDESEGLTEDYESASNEALEAEITRRGLEVPEEGSGANGRVLKKDLVDVLEENDTDDGPDADNR